MSRRNPVGSLIAAGRYPGRPERECQHPANCGGAPQWWSSDAPDGELLYVVDAVIDTWTPEKAKRYAETGYVHYHELVALSDGQLHPTKVVWLRHKARTSFTLDGGPHPELAHEVTPGIDYEFMPNGAMPYDP